jgi:transposase
MSNNTTTKSNKSAVILETEELQRYQKILTFLEHQLNLVQRAQAALEEAQFVAQAVENERIRYWRQVCEAHGLDPDADYTIDPTGRVFQK